MRTRVRNPFTTVQTSGLLLPVDLLARIVDGDPSLPGLTPDSYHLNAGERLNEAAARAWNTCVGNWKAFREASRKLPPTDQGTTLTRDKWLLPLFRELGYGWLQANKRSLEIDGKPYPVSHQWQSHVPVHLVSFKYDVDRRTPGATGAAQRSPYSLVQEFLNRSAQHRWGFVSNGHKLVVLHDNVSLVRASNVEFDLEAMFDGEVYSDFVLLFALCHQSRVEILAEDRPEECWLECWSKLADEQGTRAREKLRVGVERAIQALGTGFRSARGNGALNEALRTATLDTQEFYRELLRMVYRILLLLVAEDKRLGEDQNLLHPPDSTPEARGRYRQYYSLERLRKLASLRRGTAHSDLYESLKVLFVKLRVGYARLAIPGLGSFLFSPQTTPHLDVASLANEHLLEAIRHLCYTEDVSGRGGSVLRPVDFGNLGSEELGSVYESLLELHPRIDTDEGPFLLAVAAGHERKTTGSYYTPTSLISCLLDSALEPVVQEALAKPIPEEALLNLKVCDPACGSGHFLIAAAERLAKHLARLRTGDDEPSLTAIQHAKRDVIARCIFGVDLNGMAAELCKVSLWMESLEPGKPLSFLDHHIQVGNSLLGPTPALLKRGIPDEALDPIEQDDKAVCREYRKRNKDERKGQGTLFDIFEPPPWRRLGNFAEEILGLEAVDDSSLEGVRTKEQRYTELVRSTGYEYGCLLADAWCAAFMWKKVRPSQPESFLEPITETIFRTIEENPHKAADSTKREVQRLRSEFQFFHWHLAFPDVFCPLELIKEDDSRGWSGGFDLVLGNPPWDTLSPDQREFFSTYAKGLRSMAPEEQENIIQELQSNSTIREAWEIHCRELYASVRFMKNSGRYRLFAPGNLGKGDFNTYRMFIETALMITRNDGYLALVVPGGIYGGANASAIRKYMFDSCRFRRLFGLINTQRGWFRDVDIDRFATFVTQKGGRTSRFSAQFGLKDPTDLARPPVTIDAEVIRKQDPGTYVIQDIRDTQALVISQKMYGACPAFGDESAGPPIRHYQREMDMGIDRGLFTTHPTGLPLYEGRMIDHYDHRAKIYVSGHGNSAVWQERLFRDPQKAIVPQWRVLPKKVPRKVGNRVYRYRIGFGDIANPRNERSFHATLIPPNTICGDTVPTIIFKGDYEWAYLPWLAVANSMTVDAIVRTKLSSSHLKPYILDTLPFPKFKLSDAFVRSIAPKVLRLVCTSVEMTSYWNAMAHYGFVEAVEKESVPEDALLEPGDRASVRAEIDAVVACQVFGLTRDELSYILESFPVLKRRDVLTHGDYRTQLMILEKYDELISPSATRVHVPLPGWI